MENPTNRPCLLVVMSAEVTVARGLQWPIDAFVVDGVIYRDAGHGDWTEFYDWFRAKDGALLGVRYWLREDLQFLAETEKDKGYVSVDPGRQIEIYFSERRDVEQKLSCDQDFLYDAVFRSDAGVYAIGFGMEALTEAELAYLGASGVRLTEGHRLVERAMGLC